MGEIQKRSICSAGKRCIFLSLTARRSDDDTSDVFFTTNSAQNWNLLANGRVNTFQNHNLQIIKLALLIFQEQWCERNHGLQLGTAPALLGGVINGCNCSANPLIATTLNHIIYHTASLRQPASQSVNQPGSEAASQPQNQLANQAVKQSLSQPVSQVAMRPADGLSGSQRWQSQTKWTRFRVSGSASQSSPGPSLGENKQYAICTP